MWPGVVYLKRSTFRRPAYQYNLKVTTLLCFRVNVWASHARWRRSGFLKHVQSRRYFNCYNQLEETVLLLRLLVTTHCRTCGYHKICQHRSPVHLVKFNVRWFKDKQRNLLNYRVSWLGWAHSESDISIVTLSQYVLYPDQWVIAAINLIKWCKQI